MAIFKKRVIKKSFEDPIVAKDKFEDPIVARDTFEDPIVAKEFEVPVFDPIPDVDKEA